MLRVLSSVLRHHSCNQVSTWSRAFPFRQKIRCLHQSVSYSSSLKDDINKGGKLEDKEFQKEEDQLELQDKESVTSRVPPQSWVDVAFQDQKKAYNKEDVDLQDWKGGYRRQPYLNKSQIDSGKKISGRGSGEDGGDFENKPRRHRLAKADEFGLLSADDDSVKADLVHDEDQEMEAIKEEREDKAHVPLGTYNRKHIADWYGRKILKLGAAGKVKEAIDVFDRWMIKEDRVKPTVFEFEVLIQILGRVGYTQKAFKLYNQMVKLGIKDFRSPHLYTSLFNACANSPWPEDGLARANKLRHQMLTKGKQPTYITYNSMIRAFGLCGDLNMAFLLADEAAQIHKVCSNLLSSLLIACISDTESGFRHAILVWRKMKQMGVEPDLYAFKLLMRAVNECGIGPPEIAKDILIDKDSSVNQLEAGSIDTKQSKMNKGNNRRRLLAKQARKQKLFTDIDKILNKYEDTDRETEIVENKSDKLDMDLHHTTDESAYSEDGEEISVTYEKPDNVAWWQMDILADKPEQTAVINAIDTIGGAGVLDPDIKLSEGFQLDKVKTKQDRLALIGGYSNILRAMEPHVPPDIAFFTLCIQAIPADCEDHMLDEMEIANIKPDVIFYNILVRKRAMRMDYDGVCKLEKLFKDFSLVPDIRTFRCLAMTCKTKHQGFTLLKSMEKANIEPNVQIYTSLLSTAYLKFGYMSYVLKQMEKNGVKPTKSTIHMMEKKLVHARKLLADKEKNPTSGFNHEEFGKRLDYFTKTYDRWLQDTDLAAEDHPWDPFVVKKDQDAGENEGSKDASANDKF